MSSPKPPKVESHQNSDDPADVLVPAEPVRKRPYRESHARNYSAGFFAKLALLAIIDALGVYVVMAAWGQDNALIAWSMVALLLVTNYVYFSKRALPMKYLLPGLAFLLIYQIFTIGYTGYIAFTNYGDGHNSNKEQAIEALLIQNEKRVEGSSGYKLSVVEQDGTLGFAIVDDGVVLVGTAETPLEESAGAVIEGGRVVSVPDFTVLGINDIVTLQKEVSNLRVPFSEDPEAGSIRTQDASNGYVYHSILEYDSEADTMTNVQTGVVYQPNDVGQFESPDGDVLPVGWRVVVGFDNFKTAFGDSRYSEPFVKVLVWTIVFSVLSVITTFALGLFLAVVLNDERVKGRRILRSVMILPYAFPAFMSFLLWRGMLNTDYGFINTILLGGADIPWLSDPNLAKLAVLGVQLWVGFPYMFLICTGALQSIPGDVIEAAKIDGAGVARIWKSVTMPLLLIAVAPLLISSFAFNFNNFNIIEMLTGGGPRFVDASVPVGHTDILITMVYAISGLDGGAAKNYGLASALSIVIFIIVATISVIGFRRTRSLEEII
ncbi:carbohydrate ABC transporter membrane protein 1, CUT1 family [Sanguibacter gelidistatuariae]|uniref:Maltose/maltodextrin transport system permease protein n=1 Tax=Sanguibacter gelidistatuariae TaxID=1814289 RepID=A0A1G6S1M8_9MICO|nr:ABC transporter permease subunit [Sanguibacter gelidistatuariae]SDD10574.1 carbohydrate ABC transporter membrane protein 1, CUT1 family [Sanguibacter gelidistatuariae]